MDCNYPLTIDTALIGIPTGVISIGEGWLQSKYGLDQQNSKKISQCID